MFVILNTLNISRHFKSCAEPLYHTLETFLTGISQLRLIHLPYKTTIHIENSTCNPAPLPQPLASSPGHSHLFNKQEWPGDQATPPPSTPPSTPPPPPPQNYIAKDNP